MSFAAKASVSFFSSSTIAIFWKLKLSRANAAWSLKPVTEATCASAHSLTVLSLVASSVSPSSAGGATAKVCSQEYASTGLTIRLPAAVMEPRFDEVPLCSTVTGSNASGVTASRLSSGESHKTWSMARNSVLRPRSSRLQIEVRAISRDFENASVGSASSGSRSARDTLAPASSSAMR